MDQMTFTISFSFVSCAPQLWRQPRPGCGGAWNLGFLMAFSCYPISFRFFRCWWKPSQCSYFQYTTSEVVVIKGRDFVVCRMWRKVMSLIRLTYPFSKGTVLLQVGDSYVVAATSFDNDVPVVAKKKRWVLLFLEIPHAPLSVLSFLQRMGECVRRQIHP